MGSQARPISSPSDLTATKRKLTLRIKVLIEVLLKAFFKEAKAVSWKGKDVPLPFCLNSFTCLLTQ